MNNVSCCDIYCIAWCHKVLGVLNDILASQKAQGGPTDKIEKAIEATKVHLNRNKPL